MQSSTRLNSWRHTLRISEALNAPEFLDGPPAIAYPRQNSLVVAQRELGRIQVIDKGLSTACLLGHVMVAKFSSHLPLY
jgi:hypothetical protein